VKARHNGARNVNAHLQMPDLKVEDVMKSELLSWPVRKLDMCPQSDGAVAVVLTADHLAKKRCARPAWIRAVTTAHEQQYMGDSPKRLAVMRSQTAASRRLYKMVGITNPRKELDVAEIYEVASWAELAMYQNLGFCEPGEAGKLIDEGVTLMGGELPVNPSGGVLCTNPIGATAMIRVAEAALQVMGKAGDHQVPNARKALGHAYGGGSQYYSMWVVGADKP